VGHSGRKEELPDEAWIKARLQARRQARPQEVKPSVNRRRTWIVLVSLAAAAALFLLLGWEIFGTVRTFSQNRRLEQEASDLRRRADEAARAREEEVVELLEKRRRESAEKHLVQGRALALRAEELARQSPTPDLEATLKEATQYYSLFLLSYPDEVPVLVERARVHELRGALPESVVDLRRALALDPSRSDALNPKIHELEALLKR